MGSEAHTQLYVYELCINGKSKFQSFYDEQKRHPTYKTQVNRAIGILQKSVTLKVPLARNKLVVRLEDGVKFKYAKGDDIRIYFYKHPSGKQVILFGGKKGSQDNDVRRVKGLIKRIPDDIQIR